MHIQDLLAEKTTTLSFEFFPPKDDTAAERLASSLKKLKALEPDFVDVTYGAGGSTREATIDNVLELQREHDWTVVPHLTTVCHKEAEIRRIVETYAENGVENILALRGDPPKDKPDHDRSEDDFAYAADLVRYLVKFNESGAHPNGRGFGIGVAGFPEGHPDTPQRVKELEYLKAKCDAGADYICTQFFFDNHDFYEFRGRCELIGNRTPIIAGIMPITSYGQ
ncbi:MAG: methylenetetrahydrofolate reductase, partial [Phycisphaeraceae bacterium]|nr:methylenetetrahydrofolate reductase [Phycisphaeraceae bacterium]